MFLNKLGITNKNMKFQSFLNYAKQNVIFLP